MKRAVLIISATMIFASSAGIESALGQTGPSLAGCPVLPADNVWNTPVESLPVDPRSSDYIRAIGADKGVHPDFGSGLWEGAPIGIPYNIVPEPRQGWILLLTMQTRAIPGLTAPSRRRN